MKFLTGLVLAVFGLAFSVETAKAGNCYCVGQQQVVVQQQVQVVPQVTYVPQVVQQVQLVPQVQAYTQVQSYGVMTAFQPQFVQRSFVSNGGYAMNQGFAVASFNGGGYGGAGFSQRGFGGRGAGLGGGGGLGGLVNAVGNVANSPAGTFFLGALAGSGKLGFGRR